ANAGHGSFAAISAKRLVAEDQGVTPVGPPGDLFEGLRAEGAAGRVGRRVDYDQSSATQCLGEVRGVVTDLALLDRRCYPSHSRAPLAQGECVQRRRGIEQDHGVAWIDEGVESQMKCSGRPSGYEHFIDG